MLLHGKKVVSEVVQAQKKYSSWAQTSYFLADSAHAASCYEWCSVVQIPCLLGPVRFRVYFALHGGTDGNSMSECRALQEFFRHCSAPMAFDPVKGRYLKIDADTNSCLSSDSVSHSQAA